jgi:hypothetical protein
MTHPSPTNTQHTSSHGPWNPERLLWLRRFLNLVGCVTLLAFAFALMPEPWFAWCADHLGIDPFPEHPLTYYLARNLSALYGYVGVVMLFVARDLVRYHPLIGALGWGTLSFGILQLVIDSQSGLPVWWVLGEGLSTVAGGICILVLSRWASHPNSTSHDSSMH